MSLTSTELGCCWVGVGLGCDNIVKKCEMRRGESLFLDTNLNELVCLIYNYTIDQITGFNGLLFPLYRVFMLIYLI